MAVHGKSSICEERSYLCVICHVPHNQGRSGSVKSLFEAKIMDPVRLFCGGRSIRLDAGELPADEDVYGVPVDPFEDDPGPVPSRCACAAARSFSIADGCDLKRREKFVMRSRTADIALLGKAKRL